MWVTRVEDLTIMSLIQVLGGHLRSESPIYSHMSQLDQILVDQNTPEHAFCHIVATNYNSSEILYVLSVLLIRSELIDPLSFVVLKQVLLCKATNFSTSDTTSTEMTVHRMVFDELSSNEFFWGVQFHRIG